MSLKKKLRRSIQSQKNLTVIYACHLTAIFNVFSGKSME